MKTVNVNTYIYIDRYVWVVWYLNESFDCWFTQFSSKLNNGINYSAKYSCTLYNWLLIMLELLCLFLQLKIGAAWNNKIKYVLWIVLLY